MQASRMGFHEKEERNRAYRRARAAYEFGMKVPLGSQARSYQQGYLQAISDMASDHGEEELAQLVHDLWDGLQGHKE